MKTRGVFIVVDGIGGCGKSTAVRLLSERLGTRACATHEPGGTPFGEKIRKVLLRGQGPAENPLADFLLFWAARAEHMRDRIAPALKRGKVVVCDRFDSSTFAFQIAGEQHPEFKKLFWEARAATLGAHEPDLYLILDVPVDLAAARRKQRGKVIDRFDERNTAFQERVRAGFRQFAKHMGPKARIIDASGTPQETDAKLRQAVAALLR